MLEGQDVALFTYYDASDQALLELALQVVGLKMTGKLHDAKHVAMQIVQGGESTHHQQLQQKHQQQQRQQQLVLEAIEHSTDNELLDFSIVNTSGQTLLHLSVILKNEALVKVMLHCYAHRTTKEKQNFLNIQDKNAMTALHFACQTNSVEIMRLLLHAGADPALLDATWLKSCGASLEINSLLDLYSSTNTHIKRKPLSRRNSNVKSHMMHRFHALSNTSSSSCSSMSSSPSFGTQDHRYHHGKLTPNMESDGLGFVRQKIDRRLYLFWLPVLIRKSKKERFI